MAHLPHSVRNEFVQGLKFRNRGKVRDSYNLPDHPDKMFQVVSDRLSIFDVVLPGTIPFKGYTLNAVNVWWRQQFPDHKHDLIAFGSAIDAFLPAQCRGNIDLHRRATVVRKLDNMISAELIVRKYLTGTALELYKKSAPDHNVCGNKLPAGLKKWSEFERPIFTPTTKAEVGHDEAMNVEEFIQLFGREPADRAIALFEQASEIARSRGLILIDSKLEGNADTTGDELFTPDSSRYSAEAEFRAALSDGKEPPSLDKQFVREWGKATLGLNPSIEITDDLLLKVEDSSIPSDIVDATVERYQSLALMLFGMSLDTYQSTW